MVAVIEKERAIRGLVKTAVQAYAAGFERRHLQEVDDPNGTINMKVHNVFIAVLGSDIQYYAALVRSLDSSLGTMLEKLAIGIAELSYRVSRRVEGHLMPTKRARRSSASIWACVSSRRIVDG